ncbi:hypothetical protein EMIHUDRAFT_444021 [Emiliania huxleyi CCMP1516]|uniref:RRM domain-containing protein n=2 Tax=Emiliania huxleyi TaxID=2903 RepID=A0A0D3JJH9_EMIH1|nr:hypothetical protein EMIHUDRAFT_444021 [Emiliania huxleyi CCMP1516]EOD23664.1 hypothetical protein EMIHUDRAFT_444021 [Emiliania huxleyi CCMP1516]|eukprot:XP_005776093.1 hypothetical protein EMIHUDRAFT_444021 [Emiliania huxleyi CCMP1516]
MYPGGALNHRSARRLRPTSAWSGSSPLAPSCTGCQTSLATGRRRESSPASPTPRGAGYLVFRNQSLPGTTLRAVSEYFGGLAAEHTCHAAAKHSSSGCQTGRSTESCESGRSGTPTEASSGGSSRTCSSTRRPCPARRRRDRDVPPRRL